MIDLTSLTLQCPKWQVVVTVYVKDTVVGTLLTDVLGHGSREWRRFQQFKKIVNILQNSSPVDRLVW